MQINEQVPTLRQVYQELKQSHSSLSALLEQLHVNPLPQHSDLRYQKTTLAQVLSTIPQDEKLLQYIWSENGHKFSETIKNYGGPYTLIREVQDHIKQLTPEQKKNYYLLAHLNPPIVSEQYNQSNPEKLNKLASYSEVKSHKKFISRYHEKNTISKHYFSRLKQEAEAAIEKLSPSTTVGLLHKFDLLVNICYYDSHNSEKQLEFVCLEDTTLLELVQKFDCMVVRLEKDYVEGVYKYCGSSDKINIEIMSMNDNHNERQQSRSLDDPLQYIVIDDFIFYDGNLNILHSLLQAKSNCNSDCNYRFFKMRETKVGDLRVVFGYPYLFRHLGGCDHIIIFKEARLWMGNEDSNYDPPFRKEYPFMVFESKMKRKKCQGCRSYFAAVISLADPLKNKQNLFLCNKCFEDLQLNQENEMKYRDLQIIPYIHD